MSKKGGVTRPDDDLLPPGLVTHICRGWWPPPSRFSCLYIHRKFSFHYNSGPSQYISNLVSLNFKHSYNKNVYWIFIDNYIIYLLIIIIIIIETIFYE